MTRRNEDSGLIDLDALMREAATTEAVAKNESKPDVTAPVPTSAPSAARTEAPTEARPSSSSTKAATPAAASSSKERVSVPAAPSTVRPPAMVARDKGDEPEPTSKSDSLPDRTSYTKGDKLMFTSVANDVTPDAPAVAAKAATPTATKAAARTKSVPPAPATMPSKLEPDSLDPITTESGVDSRVSSTGAATVLSTARPSTQPEPRRRGLVIGVLLAAALLGGFMFVRSRSSNASSTTAAVTATATVEQRPTAPATAAPTAEPTPAPTEEPQVVASAAPSASAAPVARHAAVGAKKTDQPAAAATLSEGALETAAPSGAGDLGDAMRGAVGPRAEAKAETKETSGPNASQVRPSPGAVVGALGSVMPAARACLTADDTVRSGLIVFKSDGTVERVEIKGSKPEDDCVRSALSKAKVAPFVDETFSTRVTVRP